MSRKDTGRISAAERALIKSCAENGVGIENLGNGSTFRFMPKAKGSNAYAAPSGRGTYAPSCKPGCLCRKMRTWKPARLSLSPQYTIAMAGDPSELTKARADWAKGDATKLIQYLSSTDW